MVNTSGGYIASSLQEALELRASQDVIPYAGGTDLMVGKHREAEYLFLNRVPELRQITEDAGYVRIGAAVTFSEALASPLVPQLMKEAVSGIAAPAIRNAGTFGGNLANGSPKADSVLVEVASDAKLRLVSRSGERTMDVDGFCLGRGRTALRSDELIAEVLMPKQSPDCCFFEKIGGRSALAISRVSFAGIFDTQDGRITNIAAAFGAVADTVLRFRQIEAALIGKTVEEARALRESYVAAYAEQLVLTRGRVSAEYRRAVCLNLLNAFLSQCGL